VIQNEYHELFNNALIARYGTVGQFTKNVLEVKSLLIDTYLVAIERYVAAETAKAASPPPASS
jgi:hypothetical protein